LNWGQGSVFRELNLNCGLKGIVGGDGALIGWGGGFRGLGWGEWGSGVGRYLVEWWVCGDGRESTVAVAQCEERGELVGAAEGKRGGDIEEGARGDFAEEREREGVQGRAHEDVGEMGVGDSGAQQAVAHLAGLLPHGRDGGQGLRRRRGVPARPHGAPQLPPLPARRRPPLLHPARRPSRRRRGRGRCRLRARDRALQSQLRHRQFQRPTVIHLHGAQEHGLRHGGLDQRGVRGPGAPRRGARLPGAHAAHGLLQFPNNGHGAPQLPRRAAASERAAISVK
jgi:hypothetical protein